MSPNPAAFQYKGYVSEEVQSPIQYTPKRHAPSRQAWPPAGLRLSLIFRAPDSAISRHAGVTVTVTYEMYDNVPILSKWVTINPPVNRVNGLSINASIRNVEYLATNMPWYKCTEVGKECNWLHTDTDWAWSTKVTWGTDPAAGSQLGSFEPIVNASYSLYFTVPLDEPFTSFRVRHILVGTGDAERQGLAKRRMLRLLAPWTQESPIFFHMTKNDNKSEYAIIDQMAEVGFEMLIFSFGSGFNIESTNSSYIDDMAKLVAYANSRGIEVGGYDLIAETRRPPAEMRFFEAIDPHTGKGRGSACFASGWYDYLLERFMSFIDKTGISMVETDGPYGIGYTCGALNHAHHEGAQDSVYQQARLQGKFFTLLQERGIYINQPDNYFYFGGSKTGLGYNENQYSLPRWTDLSVSRQGMFDDLYHYIPTIGWMFLPLVDYHGGGSEAAFEPLQQHLQEYEWGLAQYLGAGVAACYRGYRLYDTPQTKAMVKKWVDFYKKYRDILSSDIIHVRRADMQSIDCFMHVNPSLSVKGLAMVFNPTGETKTMNLSIPLYYTGLDTLATIKEQDLGTGNIYTLHRDYTVEIPVKLAAKSLTWYSVA